MKPLTRTCNRCHQEKSPADFYTDRSRPDGLQYHCKDCQKAYTGSADALSRRRSRYDAKEAWRTHLRRSYDITEEDWHAMLIAQSGRCASCSDPLGPAGRNIHVDHCHETGKIRGLLCRVCNRSEGLLKDPRRALGLYRYMSGF